MRAPLKLTQSNSELSKSKSENIEKIVITFDHCQQLMISQSRYSVECIVNVVISRVWVAYVDSRGDVTIAYLSNAGEG